MRLVDFPACYNKAPRVQSLGASYWLLEQYASKVVENGKACKIANDTDFLSWLFSHCLPAKSYGMLKNGDVITDKDTKKILAIVYHPDWLTSTEPRFIRFTNSDNILELTDSVPGIAGLNADKVDLKDCLIYSPLNRTNLDWRYESQWTFDGTSIYEHPSSYAIQVHFLEMLQPIIEQIEQIVNQITIIEGDITQIKNEISNILNEISSIYNEISDIRTDITQLTNEIAQITNDINIINNTLVGVLQDISNLYDEDEAIWEYIKGLQPNALQRQRWKEYFTLDAASGISHTHGDGHRLNYFDVTPTGNSIIVTPKSGMIIPNGVRLEVQYWITPVFHQGAAIIKDYYELVTNNRIIKSDGTELPPFACSYQKYATFAPHFAGVGYASGGYISRPGVYGVLQDGGGSLEFTLEVEAWDAPIPNLAYATIELQEIFI